jgi:hypothetical protein
VVGLLTTVNQTHDRVAMHAAALLLERQAEAAGPPLVITEILSPCSNEVYRPRCAARRRSGWASGRFRDLYLEDVRSIARSKWPAPASGCCFRGDVPRALAKT